MVLLFQDPVHRLSDASEDVGPVCAPIWPLLLSTYPFLQGLSVLSIKLTGPGCTAANSIPCPRLSTLLQLTVSFALILLRMPMHSSLLKADVPMPVTLLPRMRLFTLFSWKIPRCV